MTERPTTYEQIWQQYAAGKVSDTVMWCLLDSDEVFRAWCRRKAESIRRATDNHRLADDQEDMA